MRCWLAWRIFPGRGRARRRADIVGKTSRRAHSGKDHPLHTASAWATCRRVVPGRQAVGSKSNEIMAIPILLGRLQLAGALVTIDATARRTRIARTMLDRCADDRLALTHSQASLAEEAEMLFQTPDQPSTLPLEAIGASDRRIGPRRHRVPHAPVISTEEVLRRNRILIQERFLVLELSIAAAVRQLVMSAAWELAPRRREARCGRADAADQTR